MSLIRPEARATLWKLREVFSGAVIGGLGLFWGLTALAPLAWVGWGMLVLGGVVVAIGVQRVRFSRGHGGPGVVHVDEGQIAYFGPYDGGAIALSELSRLELDPEPEPAVWHLYQPGQQVLSIPVTAENADTLFDSFAALPGMRTERMLSALRSGGEHRIVIWAKEMRRLH